MLSSQDCTPRKTRVTRRQKKEEEGTPYRSGAVEVHIPGFWPSFSYKEKASPLTVIVKTMNDTVKAIGPQFITQLR